MFDVSNPARFDQIATFNHSGEHQCIVFEDHYAYVAGGSSGLLILDVSFPDIPWRDISGFRNILTHNYLGDIDPLTIVAVVDRHLPALEAAVLDMLASDGAPAAGAGARRDE